MCRAAPNTFRLLPRLFGQRLPRRLSQLREYPTMLRLRVCCGRNTTCALQSQIAALELVATQRAFLRQVCAVEEAWVAPILPRLRDVDVKRLSGGKFSSEKTEAVSKAAAPAPAPVKAKPDAGAVDAARQRFLERKRKAEAQR